MPLQRLAEHMMQHAWQLLASAVVGLVGLGSWVGTIEWRLPSKAEIQQTAVVQSDVAHIKKALDELTPVVQQTATDVAVLKARVEDAKRKEQTP